MMVYPILYINAVKRNRTDGALEHPPHRNVVHN